MSDKSLNKKSVRDLIAFVDKFAPDSQAQEDMPSSTTLATQQTNKQTNTKGATDNTSQEESKIRGKRKGKKKASDHNLWTMASTRPHMINCLVLRLRSDSAGARSAADANPPFPRNKGRLS
jgi:hypothetical protein